MKALLMYPDRDFDPQRPLPWQADALTQDLELETLLAAMAREDELLYRIGRQAVFSSMDKPDEIRYRQAVLQDCLRNPAVVRELYAIPLEAAANKRTHWLGIFSSYPSGILDGALEMMQMLVEQLRKLRRIADEHAHQFESKGFARFFSMIQSELDDRYFSVVQSHLEELQFKRGVLLSARLGQGNEGSDYTLRKPHGKDPGWVKRVTGRKTTTYSFTLHPRDDYGARTLSEIKDQGVNLVANALAQSADHLESFLNMLGIELAFYIGCLNLSETLSRLGEPIVFPEPAATTERKHAFTGLYDVCLALTMQRAVVGNDANADGRDLVIITGANQGGKSTFLRSVGLAQLMMQCGMFVPAESFSANVCHGLFSHYKREEDTTMTSGKLDEELARMSEIVDHIQPQSMVLFNESFAATNEREGSEIARQIVSALLQRQVKIFFVTHLYSFAHGMHRLAMENAFFLRAERQPDGSRTFKLVEGEPLETSFGADLYRKIFVQAPSTPQSEGRG